MVSSCRRGDSDIDDQVEAIIKECLNPKAPKSFFLYAGAGSGKTYSLVRGLETFKASNGNNFRRKGKQIAVITYTNAACDEIIDRVKGDPLFHISTIHSFCWLQIQPFNDDIRNWLKQELPTEIQELQQQEVKGRPGTQASITRQRDITKKRKRLDWLSERRQFTYNPNGDNIGKASLSHTEVLKICANFMVSKPSFQQILVNRYPFLLIDESQDTNKELIEAFLYVEEQQKGRFSLGLIGDMMQRIYGDGKPDLGTHIPKRWAKPVKQLNRRCPSRIVALANDIRAETDQLSQKVLTGKPDGFVRIFIAPTDAVDKPGLEQAVKDEMSIITGDPLWGTVEKVKHLMLEHMMAATRLGFSEMYGALATSKNLLTGLRNGELPAVRLFSEQVLTLYTLEKTGRHHAVMTHLRRFKSPLVDPDFLRNKHQDSHPLKPVREAIDKIVGLIDQKENVSFYEVLQHVFSTRLFSIPESLTIFTNSNANMETDDEQSEIITEENTSNLDALERFLKTPFNQIRAYKDYVSGNGPFDTHQGVKGREFERVLVVMDDGEAGGFLFSYEKMFEVEQPSKSDLKRISDGHETGLDRTKRLFYVTCTRAEKSLVLIAYTKHPELLKARVIDKGWFDDAEIIIKV